MFHTLSNLVDYICQPDINRYKDRLKREINLKHNKGALFMQFSTFLALGLYILLTDSAENSLQKYVFLTLLAVFIIFLFCCRSHPKILKIIYFLVTTLYCPFVYFYIPESLYFNFISASILPIWMLCLSDSVILFIVQVLVQNFWLNTLAENQLVQLLDMVPSSYFAHKMIEVSSLGTILTSAYILSIKLALDNSYSQTVIIKSKAYELQRQKTNILEFCHELRNLINTIINTGNLCLLEGVSSKVKELLNSSQVCGDLVIHLVNNVLDTGKSEIGDLEVVPKVTYSYDLLEKVWYVCSQLIAKKRLYGEMKIYKNVPQVLEIDKHRMFQIFLNLVMNAIKFTEKGSIHIIVDWIEGMDPVDDKCFEPSPFPDGDDDEGVFEKDETLSHLRADAIILNMNHHKITMPGCFKRQDSARGILKITVKDTGCGIAANDISKLFNKFTQVSEDLEKKTQGAGLGLFITKQLVGKMNGRIKVFSKIGRGSAFIACLPIEGLDNCQKQELDKEYLQRKLDSL